MNVTGHPNRGGQAISETLLLLPLYLLLVFALLQLGQLGTALVITNYAASTVARDFVQNNSVDNGAGEVHFRRLMVAGMKNATIESIKDQNGMLSNVTVHACAEIDAFPLVGSVLGRGLSSHLSGTNCQALSYVGFTGSPPYRFIVHGTATLRMNYQL